MDSTIWWIAGLGTVGAVILAASRASAAPSAPTDPGSATPPPPAPPSSPPAPPARETGTAFAARVAGTTGAARDAEVLRAVEAGNVPSWVGRDWLPVPVRSGSLSGTVYVAPDFFGVGTDTDWVRWAVLPKTAQRIADTYGAVLPTKKLADAIQTAATAKIRMYPSSTNRDATATYVATNNRVQAAVAGRAGLLDGQKKNILVADSAQPGKIIIYGGINPDSGMWPLQPYSGVHSDAYRDYSHGTRLVRRAMVVDGRGEMDILDVMRDATLAPLVSDRRTDRNTRYRE